MKKKIYYIPEGIVNIQPLFPAIDLSRINKYSVTVKTKSGNFLAESRINEIGCCCNDRNKIRLYFINDLGEIDSLNLTKVQKSHSIKSSSWEKSKGFQRSVSEGGVYRTDIRVWEHYEGETKCYNEQDQEWLAEMMRSPRAWIESQNNDNSFFRFRETPNHQIPIVIADVKFTVRKNQNRFEYIVKVSFMMANKINTKR